MAASTTREGFLPNVNSLKEDVAESETREVLLERDNDDGESAKYYFAKTVQEFKEKLKDHETNTNTKYVLRCGPKSFTRKIISFSTKSRLHWHENVPYFHFGTRFYNCHRGKDNNIYQKKKYAREREEKLKLNDGTIVRPNTRSSTKKVGCPAAVNVTRMYRMPGFKLTTKLNHKAKMKVSWAIKDRLAKGVLVDGEEAYMFTLPDPCEHRNHSVGRNDSPDPRLIKKINELVNQGKTGASAISKQLEAFVATELCEINKTDEQFYPNIQTIKTLVSNAKRNMSSSKIDLDKTRSMLESWKSSRKILFFLPQIDESCNGIEGLSVPNRASNSQSKESNAIILVYQDDHMKQLYERYGSNTVLLDPVYRVCKYAIPIYFLIVKTNVGFAVVGIIVTRVACKESLCQALTIFKEWNNQVHPKYALADMCKDEILAIEMVYPTISVLVCSFHRDRAWNQWTNKWKNLGNAGEVALVFLHQVCEASTEEELQLALQELKSLPFYATSPLKSYFESLWLKEIHRWALAYQPEDMLFNIDSSVACLNEHLNYKHLESYKHCLLSELICNLLQTFLPEHYALYVQKNLEIVSQSHCDMPIYFHNRPKWLVDHLQTICAVAEQLDSEIDLLSPNKFSIHSTTCPEAKQLVSFDPVIGASHCTCYEYRKTGLICHHIVRIGDKYPDWNLRNIHTWLLNNPVFTHDESVVTIQSETDQPMGCISCVLDTPSATVNSESASMVKDIQVDCIRNTVKQDAVQPIEKTQENLIEETLLSMHLIKTALGNLDVGALTDLASKFKAIVDCLPTSNSLIPLENETSRDASASNTKLSPEDDNMAVNVEEKCPSAVNVTHVFNLQNLHPDLGGEVFIGNVVFDFDCNVPLPVGAVTTVESVNIS